MSLIQTFLGKIQDDQERIQTRNKDLYLFLQLIKESLDELFERKFVCGHNIYASGVFSYQLIQELKAPNIGQFKFFYGKEPIIQSEFDDNLNFLKDGIILKNNMEESVSLSFDCTDILIIQSHVYDSEHIGKQLLTKDNLKVTLSGLFNTAKVKSQF